MCDVELTSIARRGGLMLAAAKYKARAIVSENETTPGHAQAMERTPNDMRAAATAALSRALWRMRVDKDHYRCAHGHGLSVGGQGSCVCLDQKYLVIHELHAARASSAIAAGKP